MDAKIEHLKIIQAVIARMAQNSFFLKGWTVTIIAAIFALFSKDPKQGSMIFTILLVLTFWLLDAYFLRQERLFRNLYDKVRANENNIDFSMDTSNCQSEKTAYCKVLFSTTLRIFYIGICGLIIIAYLAINIIIFP